MRVSFNLAVAIVCCGMLLGCGESSPPGKPTATVKGKITLKGAALPAGTVVTFLGTGAGAVAASGNVVEDGTFRVAATIGSNTISVSPPPAPKMNAEDMMRLSEKGKQPEAKSNIPQKFQSLSTSGMTLDVKAGENSFNFDITE